MKEYIDKKQMFDLIYPIGAIYLSVSPVDPELLFEVGKWEKIEDSFLLTSGSKYTNGTQGGKEKVSYTPKGTNTAIKLTAQQLPNRIIYADKNLSGQALSGLSGIEWDNIPIEVDEYFASCSYDIANNTILRGNTTSGMTSITQTTHNHTFTGTAATIETMPPYLVINAWKRVE